MAIKSVRRVPSQKFFVTTPAKIAALSLVTLGLYELYWMYKNWRIIRPDENTFVSFLRAFFGPYFVFSLLKNLGVTEYKKLGVIYLLISLLGFLPSNYMMLSCLSFIVLVVAQSKLNKTLDAKVSAPFSKKAIAFSVVGVILTAFVVIALTSTNDEPQKSTMQNSSHHTHEQTQKTDSQQSTPTESTTQQSDQTSVNQQTSTTSVKAINNTTTPKTIAPTPKTPAASVPSNKVETGSQNGAPLILSTSTLNISLSSFNRLPVTISSPDGLPMPMPTGAYNNTPFVFGWDATSGSQPPSKAASWTLVFDAASGIAPGSYVYHFSAGTSTDNWQTATVHRADLIVNITQ